MASIINNILKVFAGNGLFDEGVELIGSWCFYLYQMHLGVKMFPLKTPDIDFCFPYPYKGKKTDNFIRQLEVLGFEIDFNPDGSIFLYNPEIKIEFITEEKGKGFDNAVEIKALGIKATPLRYIAILFEDPIVINDHEIEIKVPNPVKFCFHKLLVASKRRKLHKRMKDIEQAIRVSEILSEAKLKIEFGHLPKKWRIDIIKLLNKEKNEFLFLETEISRLMSLLQDVEKIKGKI